ncbi:sel1 repeat family protein [Dasania sp. GY-MA-18]|uniref:Tetratricopeptide repeat protein n=1 Tax=Dasania phycosphaerae TaxID=2950436 RepID=A0A9J6RKG2_9GAMM|nr:MULTISPECIES: tetratricopeptide repeat protein [Dasania]MCR8922464.1 sel1 repeat family protein [Dasania sp. GY-MA-18]MCZ0864892.1 tetratricopeptide repeat protein [Dasania phycosphaerae]MCZ0868620.1 tetratricopeptide repeat protein [Dasania phycosphaerae]
MKTVFLIFALIFSMPSFSTNPTEEELSQAATYYLDAAKAGDPHAQLYMSYAYWNAWGVPKNEKIARRWLQKSADQVYPLAVLELGQRKLAGGGYNRDISEGINLLKQAAALGVSEAQASLGAYYLGLNPVDKVIDSKLGMDYLLQAKSLGNSNAMMYLGLMYQTGVEPGAKLDSDLDLDQAIFWHTKSAEKLNIYAIGNLGFIYSNPGLYNVDSKKAYFWYQVAKMLGVNEWSMRMIEMELRISKASRNEMKAKAEDWVKTHAQTIN